jgi:nicotinamidase/pyrazinamidase
MGRFAGAPDLADEQDAFRGAYAARFQAFTEAGRAAQLAPVAQDTEKIALILLDYQHDFVDPTGTLFVPGAQEDVTRLLRWFYLSAPAITTIYASLDTHLPLQIFFSAWWQNPHTGEHPQPFTTISVADLDEQRWIPLFQPDWSVKYVRLLAEQSRKELMIWPHHTMQGTLGQMLVAPISEAIAWHSAARTTQPTYVVKGLTTHTEFYGIFGAEVPDPRDPSSSLNSPLLEAVLSHDRVYIAGEAKSHCVLETERQLITYAAHRPELFQRLYFLTDCTSSVAHPRLDFDALAEQELARMAEQGAHLARSVDLLNC